MKILVLSCILASLAAIVLCDDDNYDKSKAKCMRNENVSETEVNNFFGNGMKPLDATPNLMCFIKCSLKKRDLFENGNFMDKSALNYFKRVPALMPFPNIDHRVSECKTQRGANDCETAYKITICLMGAQ